MDIKKDLEWIVEAQNRKLPRNERCKEEDIQRIMEEMQTTYEKGEADFSKYTKVRLRQGRKIRDVKMYDTFTSEEFLSIYLHNQLKYRFKVEFPNRNTYIRSLINTVYALKDMSDYTIYKFDFEDFFNSVSSVYVYQKFIRGQGLERDQEDLLEKYVKGTRYAYAGLCTSNILCEIAAQHFDNLLRQSCSEKGLIYYRRYIDDGVLIFNRYLSKEDCQELVNRAIEKTFHDSVEAQPRCKTALKKEKTKYIARRDLAKASPAVAFDFLGYEFTLAAKGKTTEIIYGITDEKKEKYRKRVRKFMKHCAADSNGGMVLLRHQLRAFTHRAVYQVERNKQTIWINKGFLANYHELGNHLDQLSDSTRDFLKNVLTEEADAILKSRPYFLRDSDNPESIYSLYHNLQRNRTQVFVERIGIDYKKLQSMCQEIGIDPDSCKGYDGLLKAYLNRVGVGY